MITTPNCSRNSKASTRKCSWYAPPSCLPSPARCPMRRHLTRVQAKGNLKLFKWYLERHPGVSERTQTAIVTRHYCFNPHGSFDATPTDGHLHYVFRQRASDRRGLVLQAGRSYYP